MVATIPSSRSISSASVRMRPRSFQRISMPASARAERCSRWADRTGVAHRTAPGQAGATGAQLAHGGLDLVGRAGLAEPGRVGRFPVRLERGVAGEHLAEDERARIVLGCDQLEAQAVALGRQRVADMLTRQLEQRLAMGRVEAQLGDDRDRLANGPWWRHVGIPRGPAQHCAAGGKPIRRPCASGAPAGRCRRRRRRSRRHRAASSGRADRRSRHSR